MQVPQAITLFNLEEVQERVTHLGAQEDLTPAENFELHELRELLYEWNESIRERSARGFR